MIINPKVNVCGSPKVTQHPHQPQNFNILSHINCRHDRPILFLWPQPNFLSFSHQLSYITSRFAHFSLRLARSFRFFFRDEEGKRKTSRAHCCLLKSLQFPLIFFHLVSFLSDVLCVHSFGPDSFSLSFHFFSSSSHFGFVFLRFHFISVLLLLHIHVLYCSSLVNLSSESLSWLVEVRDAVPAKRRENLSSPRHRNRFQMVKHFFGVRTRRRKDENPFRNVPKP